MIFPKMWYVRPASLRSACAYAQSDQSLCQLLEYSMIVKLLTKHHLEFLTLTGGCRGSSETTYVKMSHCWKSHALAQLLYGELGWFPSDILIKAWMIGFFLKRVMYW